MIKDLYDLLDCSALFEGDGQQACEISRLKDLKGMVLRRKGFVFKQIPTEQEWRKAILDGNIYPIIGLFAFTQDTPDTEVQTSETGFISPIRASKPQFSFSYQKGYCAHKKLYSKQNGFWDIDLLFEAGLFTATSIKKDVIKGFDAQPIIVESYRFQQGTDGENSTAKIQLRNAEEFNRRGVILTWEKLGFDASEIDGVIEVAFKEVDIKAGSEIKVKVVGSCNSSEAFAGLEDKNNWLVNGVVPSTVSYNASDSSYTLTVTDALIAGDNVTISLNGLDARDLPYKGNAVFVVKA